MSGKTVVVTGISGHFGRALRPHLKSAPRIERVIGLDREPPGDEGPSDKLDFHPVDLRESGWEHLLEGADTVIHLAFLLLRLPGHRDLDRLNVEAMRRVCEASARARVRKLIIPSSVVAYGLHPDNPAVLTEESPLRPNPGLYYGRAKAANEQFLDDFERQHPEMIVTRLRPCTVIGPHVPPPRVAALLGSLAFLVRGFDPPIQLVHEEDVASALLLAIEKDLPGAYNVTGDGPLTARELARLQGARTVFLPFFLVRGLMSLTWRLGVSEFAPEWVDLSRYSLVASNAKLKLAGWTPKYTTAQAFAGLLASRRGARP